MRGYFLSPPTTQPPIFFCLFFKEAHTSTGHIHHALIFIKGEAPPPPPTYRHLWNSPKQIMKHIITFDERTPTDKTGVPPPYIYFSNSPKQILS